MLTKCPYSGETFIPRRKNQVFATSKNRQRFHNEIAKKYRDIKAPIDRILFKNFLILEQELKKGETKVLELEYLRMQGFNNKVFTHLDIMNGKTCRCIYHFYILNNENPNYTTVVYPDND